MHINIELACRADEVEKKEEKEKRTIAGNPVRFPA